MLNLLQAPFTTVQVKSDGLCGKLEWVREELPESTDGLGNSSAQSLLHAERQMHDD
jgi:hypothetical protein